MMQTVTHGECKDGIYLIIDKGNCRCGITDRLKTAVGLCYLARQNGIGFYFIHRAGFDIRDYLVPNKIPWAAELSDISRAPWRVKRIEYIPPFYDFPEFTAGKQYVCRKYIGRNIMEQHKVPEWQKIWKDLFWEMFQPSEKVKLALSERKLPDHYAVVNARFVNSLGGFENTSFNKPFSAEMQERIISEVLKKVKQCEEESDVPVIVYSDSAAFLKAASERGFQICDLEGIGNIMNTKIGRRVELDTFVNFFQMSQADKIYSIRKIEGLPDNCLYTTQYPRYAAIIGDKPFIKVE